MDTHGYGADIPFQANTVGGDPFPAPTSTRQYLSAVTDTVDVQARGRLGLADDNLPSSRFQRIRMLDEACARPEHAPPDYPFYPVGDADTTYKCVRVDLQQTSNVDDPMDLHVEALKPNGTRIRLQDAGLTNLPSYVQLTLAETPTQNEDSSLRRRCGVFSGATDPRFQPYAEAPGTTDCMPPLFRFDQPDDVRLFGTLDYGQDGALTQLTGVQPREVLADLDASPSDPANWSDWGVDPLGIRFKAGTFGSGDDATTAARVNLRLPIPNAIQVDQIQSWSESSRDGKAEYWDASDFRFHFVARDDAGNPYQYTRDAQGHVLNGLGQLTGMYQTGDGTQILLSRPRSDYDPPSANNNTVIDPGNTAAFNDAVGDPVEADDSGYDEGIVIPGEVGLDLYTRNHPGRGENFTQIDGTLSEELDIGLRALGGSGSALGRAEVHILDLPGRTYAPDEGLEDPSFRFRFNTLGEGSTPPTSGQPEDPDDDDGGGNECTWYFCARTEIKFKDVFLNLDFDPTDDGSFARRVDAVVNTRDGKQGVEVAGYDSPDIGADNRGDFEGLTAQARIDIDPINVFIHAGIPIIGGADFILLSDFQAGVGFENVHNLQLRHNILHVNARSYGGPTTIGPFHYNIHLMHGSAYLLFVKLFGIDFLPPSPPPYLIGFVGCDGLSSWGLWSLQVGGSQPDEKDFVIAINNDPRLLFSGVLGSPLNILKAFIAPFFCLTDVSTSAIPLITAEHPGDPVGLARVAGHPVPGAPEAASPVVPNVDVVPTGPPDETVNAALALCGAHAFDELTVNAALTVATSVDNTLLNGTERCAAADVGSLQITATEVHVGPAGSIRGDGIVNAVTGGSSATGNSGGGHGGAGGAGSSGAGGTAYGSSDPSDANVDLTEAGSRGAGTGPGLGGATVVINAVRIDNDGTISVGGGGGNDRTSGSCDVWNGDNTAVTVANTGVAGAGAGSGGGLVLIATSVDNDGTIRAHGGAGGDGRKGGGGGGAGGIIEVISPLWSGPNPSVSGGAGGSNLCPGDQTPAANGAPGTSGALTMVQGPQSQAHSPTSFWYPGSVDIPISAAAQDGDTTGYTVFVCSMYGDPADLGGGGSQSLTALFDVPDTNSRNQPCGPGASLRATHSTATEEIVYEPGTSVTEVGIGGLADGYHGIWTVALRPNTPGNNCQTTFDDFIWGINDATDCELEGQPEQVDVVVGSDSTKPTLVIAAPADNSESNSNIVTLDLTVNDQAGLSGVGDVQCSNTGNANDWHPCTAGSQQWDLNSGDGDREVWARAYDQAGNVSHAAGDEPFVRVLVDATAPTGSVTLTGGVLGSDNWYRVRPGIQFGAYSDAGVGAGGDPFVYQFDGGAERTCASTPTCNASSTDINNLTLGGHTVTAVVRDRLGNERDLNDVDFKIDDVAPQTALRTVPAEPDDSGWFTVQPWIVLSAIDQVGASGVDAIQYRLNGTGSWSAYSGPFQLGPGQNQVCFRALDVAGNVEGESCSATLRVDDAAPGGAITFDGVAAPNPTGTNGWFATDPNVVLASFSDDQGPTPTGGTFRYRVDNSPYVDCDSPCTIDSALLQTGRHLVHWTAQDRLGNQRADGSYTVDVDTIAPTTRIVVSPAEPGRGLNGWHWEHPWVVLDAIDQADASGVAVTSYRLDGGALTTYTGPIAITDGEHTLCATSRDRAGNVEDEHCVELNVDSVDPSTAAAAPAPSGGDGWHTSPIAVTVTGGDATSGIDAAFDPSTADLCDAGRQDEDPTAPSGTCLAVDGGPFVVWDGAPLSLPEGVHRIRAFSQDVSGRRSAMVDETYRIDATAPVVAVRLVPADGNDAGWWRRFPTMVLRAPDGDPNATSGLPTTAPPPAIEYRLDGGAWTAYTQPVLLTDGLVDLDTRVRDVAGNVRTELGVDTFPIDVHPPQVLPRDPSRLIWSRLLGPKSIDLRWRVTEDLSETVRIGVIIHDATGNVVRRLDGGIHDVTPGVEYLGETSWDGKNRTLSGLVPLGVYYYRVVAVDEAGNVAHSRESRPITIKFF